MIRKRVHKCGDDPGPEVLVEDGVQFFRCTTAPAANRVRWAFIGWPDKGDGVKGYGAARNLGEARQQAKRARKTREEIATP